MGRTTDPKLQPVPIKASPRNAEASAEGLAEELTATEAFYLRSNFDEPALDPRTHAVEVGGAVDHPLRLDVAGLRALGLRSLPVTLECAGNGRLGMVPLPEGEPWRDRAVSTAEFSGVPLRAVLEQAGVQAGAVEVLFEAADRGTKGGKVVPFARSLPLERALDPDTLLALEMNGAPLTREHGAPVRLVVPGWYGMAAVKWLARIELLRAPFEGYFQRERYVYLTPDAAPRPVTAMKVTSLVTAPLEGSTVPAGSVEIVGRAWSGEGAIAAVEVSLDGGPWQRAELAAERSRHAWRTFRWTTPPLAVGRHTVRARATDTAGNVQPDRAPWNRLGYGNNAIRVHVFQTSEA